MPAVVGSATSVFFASNPAGNSNFSWKRTIGGHYSLMRNGKQVGLFNTDDGKYRAFLKSNGELSKPKEPPVSVPSAAKNLVKKVPNYGIDTSKLSKTPRYVHNGNEVTAAQAYQAVKKASPQIPDDMRKKRFTVIGSPAECESVQKDLQNSPELAPWKNEVVYQSYLPNAWELDCGFVRDGHPTIYYQTPDGKVLHRQNDYAGGAPALATALRKADPNYKPVVDPDRRKDDPLAPLNIPEDFKNPLVLLALAVGCFLLYKHFDDK